MITNQLKDYLNNNKSIKGLYISFVSKKYKISEKQSIEICEGLVDEGILAHQFEVVCHECGRITATVDAIGEIEGVDNCIFCGMMQEGFTTEDIQVYYKINR